jgi:hypothetical protein
MIELTGMSMTKMLKRAWLTGKEGKTIQKREIGGRRSE